MGQNLSFFFRVSTCALNLSEGFQRNSHRLALSTIPVLCEIFSSSLRTVAEKRQAKKPVLAYVAIGLLSPLLKAGRQMNDDVRFLSVLRPSATRSILPMLAQKKNGARGRLARTTLFPRALHRSRSLLNPARANTELAPNAIGTVKLACSTDYSAEKRNVPFSLRLFFSEDASIYSAFL